MVCLLSAGAAFVHPEESSPATAEEAADEVEEQEEPLDLETILGSTIAKEDYVDVTKCLKWTE